MKPQKTIFLCSFTRQHFPIYQRFTDKYDLDFNTMCTMYKTKTKLKERLGCLCRFWGRKCIQNTIGWDEAISSSWNEPNCDFWQEGKPPQKQANKKGKILPWTTATPKLTAMSCWLVNHYLKNQKTNKHEKNKKTKKPKTKHSFHSSESRINTWFKKQILNYNSDVFVCGGLLLS